MMALLREGCSDPGIPDFLVPFLLQLYQCWKQAFPFRKLRMMESRVYDIGLIFLNRPNLVDIDIHEKNVHEVNQNIFLP